MKSDGELTTGSILLAESCLPAMKSGRHTLNVTQQVSGDEKLNDAQLKSETFSFSCEAAGLTLGEGEVYSTYPPQDSFGLFENILPHMVLRRKTLPWERTMEADDQNCPWLALLLFSEEEEAKLMGLEVSQVFVVGKDTYCPVTEKEGYEEGDSCTVVDMAADLFCDICPYVTELPLLAHARCVNRDNKATEQSFQEEWLSVVTCSRLPCSNTTESGLRNTVCLVSLEDFSVFLTKSTREDRASFLGGYRKVRLPVVASFSFYSKKEDYGFLRYFEALTADTLRVGITEPKKEALPLLQRGFTAHNHMLRDGGRIVSFYRGPLLPWNAPDFEGRAEIFPDARLIYQPELGMFDASRSAAANLGRMLGLQNGVFAAALIRFRADNRLKAEERFYQSSLMRGVYGIEAAEMEREADLRQSLEASVLELLTQSLKTRREELAGKPVEWAKEREPGRRERVPLRAFSRWKASFFQEGSYYGFLKEDVQVPDKITDFLAEMSLLSPVPFSYLVPEERMLPEDSIRFFRVDFGWLYALLDGAMSLGRSFREDYAQDAALIWQVLSEVYEKRCALRPTLLRKDSHEVKRHVERCLSEAFGEMESRADGGGAGQVNTGFFMRSELVRGFKGLEFAAYENKGSKEQLPCLRLEVIGEDILLGIYAGECGYLEIRQPPEGMHFGVEDRRGTGDSYEKLLRSLDSGELFADEEENRVRIPLRNGEMGVFNIEKAAENIGKRLGLKKVTSAHMALQMIQNPFTGVVERK